MTTTNSSPRVGFIGAGWTERVQIPAFRLGGLTAQAIAAAHPENARRVAARFNIPAVHDTWQALIRSDQVDIVSIAAPPHLHREMATAALAAGKHVICEKPTALNASEAEVMLAAAQAAPEQLAIVDHELRFTPQRRAMRNMLREGYVGRVLWVELHQVGPYRLDPDTPWSWTCDADQGGGMLNALGSHMLDLGRWMIGSIEEIAAQLKTVHHYRMDAVGGVQRRVTADDHAQLALRFNNGVMGAILVSGIIAGQGGSSITVYGTDGALRLDRQDRLWGLRGDVFPDGEWQAIAVEDPVADMGELPNRSGYARGSVYLAQAIAAVLSQGKVWLPDAANFYDGLKAQQALDAARRSHAERRWVRL